MKALRIALLSGSLLLALAGLARAEDVVIIQGPPIQPFQDAIQGFQRALEAGIAHRGPRKIQPVEFQSLPLNRSKPDPDLLQRVRGMKPSLVLATGTLALEALRDLHDVPIVYVMVPSPPAWTQKRSNVTGVTMTISPERWLDLIRATLPGRRRLGVLYDPGRTGEFVNRVITAAPRTGISIVARQVFSSREVHERIRQLKGLIDAFWMLPDLTVVTPQSVQSMLLFSLRNRVPIITFSEKYLDDGATMAVELDFGALGRQAGEMARRILDGAGPEQVSPESPDTLHVLMNRAVAEKLGISAETVKGDAHE